MTESYVEVGPNSTGTKIRTLEYTEGSNTVDARVTHVGDPSTEAQVVAVNPSNQAAVEKLWNSGRNPVAFYADRITGSTSEALSTFTSNNNGTTSSATSYTVTSGKTLRITAWSVTIEETSTTKRNGRVRLRAASGAVGTGSPIYLMADVGSMTGTGAANEGVTYNSSVEDGIEIPSAYNVAFSLITSNAAGTYISFCFTGYEY